MHLTAPTAIAAAADRLRSIGDLTVVPRDFADALLGLARWFRHEAGDDIVSSDEPAASVHALADGIAMMRTGLAAADVAAFHTLHPGQWLGFTTLFDPQRQLPTGYVTARTSCITARIGIAQIETLLAGHPQWWRWFGVFAIRYGDTATGVSADLSLRDSRRRCFAMLLRVAGARFASSGNVLTALISQDELGAMANLSRNTANRILTDAEAAGLLTARYRAIELHDVAALRHIVVED
jgi:CRP/FNR family cyclic AMP-dependent transcriptional regulator